MIKLSGKYLSLVAGIILFQTMLFSCKNLPEPAFSMIPGDNPESGELIQFSNESVDASSFEWEFGDGGTSLLENPEYIYQESGTFQVGLTAFNEDGEKQIIQAVTINDPTILGFQIFDSTGITLLSDAEVRIYDNEDDLLNLRDPLFMALSGENGEVRFENLEPMIYYFLAIKAAQGGYWLFAYNTPVLEKNEENYFRFNCLWFPDAKKFTSIEEAKLTIDLDKFRFRPLEKYSIFHD